MTSKKYLWAGLLVVLTIAAIMFAAGYLDVYNEEAEKFNQEVAGIAIETLLSFK